MGTQPRLITPFVALIEAWLRADVALKGMVIHERLVADHGFTWGIHREAVMVGSWGVGT
jgi:hypothetical protein